MTKSPDDQGKLPPCDVIDRNRTRGWSLAEKLEFYSIPEPNSGCHLWLAVISNNGYGILRWRGVDQRAHRLAYALAHGPIPDGLLVLHKCDVRACINPGHLFLGTYADNAIDMTRKGRHHDLKGERAPTARLTADQVLAIRADSRTQAQIAADYGIHANHVSQIKRRVRWRHLEPPLSPNKP